MAPMKRVSPGVRAAALALTSLLVLAGCGGEGEKGGDDKETRSAKESKDAKDDAPKVPKGPTLPGTELDFGDTAQFAWEFKKDTSSDVHVTVQSVTAGDPQHLQGILLNPAPKAPKLYYVKLTVENKGKTELGGLSPLALPLYVNDGSRVLVRPSDIIVNFAPCPLTKFPATFPQGAKAEFCLTYLLDGSEMESLALVPDLEKQPITWTGELTKPTPPATTPPATSATPKPSTSPSS